METKGRVYCVGFKGFRIRVGGFLDLAAVFIISTKKCTLSVLQGILLSQKA